MWQAQSTIHDEHNSTMKTDEHFNQTILIHSFYQHKKLLVILYLSIFIIITLTEDGF